MNQKLIDFYTGGGTDDKGRTFDELVNLSDKEMEDSHNVIQWLFPTVRESNHNEDAPLLDDETIGYLQRDGLFKQRFNYALQKILAFWTIPFTVTPSQRVIVEEIQEFDILFSEPLPNWINNGDHNQLRIARVLDSARLLGYQTFAYDLFHRLTQFVAHRRYHQVTAKNVAYWYQGVSGVNLDQ